MASEALAKMDRLFAGMYEADIKGGRPSIAPEKLLRAMLIQVLYSIRSERQLMELAQYTLIYKLLKRIRLIGSPAPFCRICRFSLCRCRACGASATAEKKFSQNSK